MATDFTSTLKSMHEKELHYDEHKAQLRKQAIAKYGKDIFTDYFVPQDFDYNNLSREYFQNPVRQEAALPYSDAQFREFMQMEKFMINEPIIFNHKGHTIHGGYFYGVKDNKVVLFALSITTDARRRMIDRPDLNAYKFSIKLDMLINGKTPLPLLRFDSTVDHNNFIVDGKVAPNNESIEILPAPHLHINDEKAQVLSSDNLDYTTAHRVPAIINEMQSSNDPLYFKTAIDNFFSMGNVKAKINTTSPKVRDYYYYDFYHTLFDWSTVHIDTNKDILEK